MYTVLLKPLLHQNKECIGIYFTKNASLNNIIKKVAGVKWSQTQKCWYIPCIKENYLHLAKALHQTAILQTNDLKTYLQQEKAIVTSEQKELKSSTVKMIMMYPLNKINVAAFIAF
jgi:integrase/recombinase XerD